MRLRRKKCLKLQRKWSLNIVKKRPRLTLQLRDSRLKLDKEWALDMTREKKKRGSIQHYKRKEPKLTLGKEDVFEITKKKAV